jgi:hypothetical protein
MGTGIQFVIPRLADRRMPVDRGIQKTIGCVSRFIKIVESLLDTIEVLMKIRVVCPQCSSDGQARFFLESIRDDGLYTGKCPVGHDLLVATQTLRHEMLFEIALNAIRDGYFREAITSFTASAERFYEFAIRVFVKAANVSDDVFRIAWKVISAQSERQFGAYVFLYVSRYSKTPKILENRLVELRNKVVHKGYLPTKEEAINFGEGVYELIQRTVQALRENDLASVNAVLGEHVALVAQGMGTQYPRSFMVTPTALNITNDISSGYPHFQELLREETRV